MIFFNISTKCILFSPQLHINVTKRTNDQSVYPHHLSQFPCIFNGLCNFESWRKEYNNLVSTNLTIFVICSTKIATSCNTDLSNCIAFRINDQNFKNYQNLNFIAKFLFSTFVTFLLPFRQKYYDFINITIIVIALKTFKLIGLEILEIWPKFHFSSFLTSPKTHTSLRSCPRRRK